MTPRGPISYEAIKTPKRPKAKRERFHHYVDEDLRAFIRFQSCLVSTLPAGMGTRLIPCLGRIECAHVKSRGSGGRDWDNIVPLCADHHRQLHFIGRRTFEFHYSVRLAPAARKYTAAYLRTRAGETTRRPPEVP